MRRTAIVSGLLVLLLISAGCSGGGGRMMVDLPEERPGDFAVTMTSESYPSPAPDIQVVIWSDGTGTYDILFKEPRTGRTQGQFKADPADVDAVYAAVREAEFFKLKEEIIADPPIPGRGVDVLTISAAGVEREVRSEYAVVDRLDVVRKAVLKVIPPEAYSGASTTGARAGFIVDKVAKLIYREDAPEVENILEENRLRFDSFYAALDAGYHPAPSFRNGNR